MKGLNVMTIGLCLLIGMTSCKQQPSQQQQAQASVYPVLKLTTADRTLSESYTAVIESKQYVEVRPQVSGIITDVLVKEGANVRKGETLFIIRYHMRQLTGRLSQQWLQLKPRSLRQSSI